MKAISLLAIVFIIRYYAVSSGDLIGATMSFGWTMEACRIHKATVEIQADPEGTKTLVDCVEEGELEKMLLRGSRT